MLKQIQLLSSFVKFPVKECNITLGYIPMKSDNAKCSVLNFCPLIERKVAHHTRLQQKLERSGYRVSNLIHSSAISTPEAIGAATRIKADIHLATVHDLSNVAHICDESQILHAAAGILRRQISDITISDDEYHAPEEVSISNSGAISFFPL